MGKGKRLKNAAPTRLTTARQPKPSKRANAEKLKELGVTFRSVKPEEYPAAQRLIQAHIIGNSGANMERQNVGTLGAFDDQQTLIGCCTFEIQNAPNGELRAHLVTLAVAQEWRRHGIGGFLVTMIPAYIEMAIPDLYQAAGALTVYGGCSKASASFYRNNGYTVFDPGMPMPMPEGEVRSNNATYPYLFKSAFRPRLESFAK